MTGCNFTTESYQKCQRLMQQLLLPDAYIDLVERIYLPLVSILMQRLSESPLLVSIHGAQGTGKSTLVQFLELLLREQYQRTSVVLSLDDFYLDRCQREHLAQSIHPLFITRGVPGTHDLQLLQQTVEALLAGQPCVIPRFNKVTDDRCPLNDWRKIHRAADVILFEGWCNNSPVSTPEQLRTPMNELEAIEDKYGIWREYSNDQLKQYHRRIFNRTDLLLMFTVPDFQQVFAWRQKQENKLRMQARPDAVNQLMDSHQLRRFIMHFERITRHSLDQLPALADIVLPLTPAQQISHIIQS